MMSLSDTQFALNTSVHERFIRKITTDVTEHVCIRTSRLERQVLSVCACACPGSASGNQRPKRLSVANLVSAGASFVSAGVGALSFGGLREYGRRNSLSGESSATEEPLRLDDSVAANLRPSEA